VCSGNIVSEAPTPTAAVAIERNHASAPERPDPARL